MSTYHMSAARYGPLLGLLLVVRVVVAQADDSNAASSPQTPNDNPAPPNPDKAGATGKSESAITLNTGQQVAIAVVVGLVVILGLTSAILFYIAKKRQWEVRASIRRSARRVTTVIKAKTPVKANFSRRDRAMVRIDPPQGQSDKTDRRSKRSGGILKEDGARTERSNTNMRIDRDLEKGQDSNQGMRTKVESKSAPAPRFSPPSDSQGPKSSFNMESPVIGSHGRGGKGPAKAGGWTKMWSKA
jgi:hypothetical protein